MKTKFYIITRLTNKDGTQWNLTCKVEEKNFYGSKVLLTIPLSLSKKTMTPTPPDMKCLPKLIVNLSSCELISV